MSRDERAQEEFNLEPVPRCGAVHVGEPDKPCVKPRGHYPNPPPLLQPDETLWHEDVDGFKWAEPDPEEPQVFP